jgi:hypothetical protein
MAKDPGINAMILLKLILKEYGVKFGILFS